MSRYILVTDGFYYKISRNQHERSVCVKYTNGEHYTVHPDRYIIGNDGYLYKIANTDEKSVMTVIGNDNRKHVVKNEPIHITKSKNYEDLNDYKCSQPNPTPTVILKGEGNVECNEDTGICYIDAPTGTNVSVGAPKDYRKMFDGSKVWLKKNNNE